MLLHMLSKKKTSFPAILPEETKLSFGGSAGQMPDRREYEKILLPFCSVCFMVYKIAVDCVQSMSIL